MAAPQYPRWLRIAAALVVAALCTGAAPVEQIAATPHGNVRLTVFGDGPLIVMVPSAGRGGGDLAPVAGLLADAGYRVVCIDSRTEDTQPGLTLDDLATDLAAIIRTQRHGAAILVGHAAGSFAARMTAVDYPDMVRGVVLAAAGVRDFNPALSVAVQAVPDTSLGDTLRLTYLRQAFFAPDSDATAWLTGWQPRRQFGTGWAPGLTHQARWWGGGTKPILELQGQYDPFKPPSAFGAYKAEFGARVTVVLISDASHAMFPEQPARVAAAILAWAKGLSQ